MAEREGSELRGNADAYQEEIVQEAVKNKSLGYISVSDDSGPAWRR